MARRRSKSGSQRKKKPYRENVLKPAIRRDRDRVRKSKKDLQDHIRRTRERRKIIRDRIRRDLKKKELIAVRPRQDVVEKVSVEYKKRVCEGRKKRRRALFSLKRIGKGGSGPKERKIRLRSLVRC